MSEVILKTEGLTKRYGGMTAVNRLSLEIFSGEIFGFLGPNGAGKTTTISMICGLIKPDEGQILIGGHSLRDTEARTRIGVCPQALVLWERLTCVEQLQFLGRLYKLSSLEARSRAEALLNELGLSEKRDQQARHLSGGMQRRLNLALALIHDPEIVVLDEPEAGLDPQSRIQVREFIKALARRKTVILTSHNMDEVERLAERVAIIDRGELLVLDTPDRLKKSVGEGDMIEIDLAAKPRENVVNELKTALGDLTGHIEWDQTTLRVRVLNGLSRLPELLSCLRAHGLEAKGASLRPNTLEDVFIKLTGRRLRE